jgi:hypothetical protein
MQTVKVEVRVIDKQTGHEDVIHADWRDASEEDLRVIKARAPGLVEAAIDALTKEPVLGPNRD